MSSFVELKKRAVELGITATGPGRTRVVLEREIEAATGNKLIANSDADKKPVAKKAVAKEAVTKGTTVTQTSDEGPVLFFGYSSAKIAKNPFILFSNWAFTPFFDEDGRWFASNEVYMMWRKAMLFGAKDVADEIITLIPETTTEPAGWSKLMKTIKSLGKKDIGFKQDVWNANRERVMYDGLMLKMQQHPKIKAVLLSTGDRPIAEASPRDKIWGIGKGATSPEAQDPSQWYINGSLNLLGKALMAVRVTLRKMQ